MEILNFTIPKHLRNVPFVQSLHKQFTEQGELSPKQTQALLNMLNVMLPFLRHTEECPYDVNSDIYEDYSNLMAKLAKNRFRTAKGWNTCVLALESILDSKPSYTHIDRALGREEFFYGWRR